MGESTFVQNIQKIVSAVAGQDETGALVVRLNPEDREAYRSLLEKAILQDGVKILIADKECGITYHRRTAREERKVEKRLGYIPEKQFSVLPVQLNQQVQVGWQTEDAVQLYT